MEVERDTAADVASREPRLSSSLSLYLSHLPFGAAHAACMASSLAFRMVVMKKV